MLKKKVGAAPATNPSRNVATDNTTRSDETALVIAVLRNTIMESVNLGYLSEHKKNLTVSLAAWLLAYFPNDAAWDCGQYQSLIAGVDAACVQNRSIVSIKTPTKIDHRAVERTEKFPATNAIVKVYTNYDLAKNVLNAPGVVQLVESVKDADFILSVAHFKALTTLPTHQRVCQFPYEAALIRKVCLFKILNHWAYVLKPV